MSNVKLGNEYFSEAALCCPKCGEANLHQEKIESIFRSGEDNNGIMVTHKTDMVTITPKDSNEIYGRRDVLYIYFSCEHCDGVLILRIYQHKGTTYIEWVDNNHAK